MFSIDAVPFYSPDSKMQEFQFLHILASICYFLIFFFLNNIPSNIYEGVSQCGLICIFLMISENCSSFAHLKIFVVTAVGL